MVRASHQGAEIHTVKQRKLADHDPTRFSGGLLSNWLPDYFLEWPPYPYLLCRVLLHDEIFEKANAVAAEAPSVKAAVVDVIGRACWDAGRRFSAKDGGPKIIDRSGNTAATFADRRPRSRDHRPTGIDVKILNSMTCHRFLRLVVTRVWRRHKLGIAEPDTLVFEGGLTKICDALGITRNSGSKELRDVITVGHAIRIAWTSHAVGPLWEATETNRAAPGRPSVWTIRCRIPGITPRTPIPSFPRLGPRPNEHAAEAYLQLLWGSPTRPPTSVLEERTGLSGAAITLITRSWSGLPRI